MTVNDSRHSCGFESEPLICRRHPRTSNRHFAVQLGVLRIHEFYESNKAILKKPRSEGFDESGADIGRSGKKSR